MPSHQERVRRNNCEHVWEYGPYQYNFLVCAKCGGWLNEDGITIFYPKKVENETNISKA